MAEFHKSTSRYRNTPVVDFYLDVWQGVNIPARDSDKKIELESKYDERPDLLSYDLYGTPRLWWVFAMRNVDTLIDPVRDFKSGTTLFVPSFDSLEGFF